MRSRARRRACTDRGPYGYYEVNDFGTRGEASADILSLYVQDQWSINNLTLNLGLRTEREVIPSFRTDIKAEGFKFNFGDKLAPRLGASYDVHGDGRFKVYGNWGRYFDWTKYELSRGGFGGDIWRVHYRSLDTTDVFALSGTNMPGRNLWTPEAGSFRDLRVPELRHGRSEPQADEPGRDERGLRISAQGQQTLTVNYTHSNLRRTIEDLGVLENGNEVYKYVNPGEGIAATMVPSGLTTEFATPKPKRQYDALELSLAEALLEQLVRQRRATSTAASTATTRACPTRTRSRRRRRAAAPALRSSRPAASRARAAAPTARGTSTSWCGTATATWTCSAVWRRIARTR